MLCAPSFNPNNEGKLKTREANNVDYGSHKPHRHWAWQVESCHILSQVTKRYCSMPFFGMPLQQQHQQRDPSITVDLPISLG